MKTRIQYISMMLTALLTLSITACKDTDSMTAGEWDANADYANIFFEKTSESQEFAPTDPTTYAVTVKRRNTAGALTVKFKELENTDDVFTVDEAVFPDGQESTTFNVNFPTAAIGETYRLKLTTDDPNLVSSYSDDIVYQLSIIRVLWNNTYTTGAEAGNPVAFYYKTDELGNYVLDDNGDKEKVEGFALYTEDFAGPIFSGDNLTYPVQIQERDDQPGVYRMVNPYSTNYPYNDTSTEIGKEWHGGEVPPEDIIDLDNNYYIVIDATDPEKVFMNPSIFDLGFDWGYGMFSVVHLGGNYHMQAVSAEEAGDDAMAEEMEAKAEPYYGKLANGVITFPANAFYVAMANYGGGDWNFYGNGNGKFKLVLNPDLSPYVASVTSADFTWEDVFEGVFNSEKYDDSWAAKLQVGTCVNTTDGADARWTKENGQAYRIVAPYAEGYDLYFSVLNDEVNIPNGLELQPLGISSLGEDVYAKIDAGKSSFSERVISLNITFTNEDGSKNFGTTDEVLSYITWTQVGTGDYTYWFFGDYDEETDTAIPLVDEGYALEVRDDKQDTYRLTEWGYGVDFVFTWDKETNNVSVAIQYTGYSESGNGGDWYVMDIPTFQSEIYEAYPYEIEKCYFDPETSTFVFNLAYFGTEGFMDIEQETFKVTFSETGEVKSIKRVKSMKTPAFKHAKKMSHKANVQNLPLMFKRQKASSSVARQKSNARRKSMKLQRIANSHLSIKLER